MTPAARLHAAIDAAHTELYPSPQRGAVVEIVDPDADGGVVFPRSVRVNGVDVGWVTEDGVEVRAGSKAEPATVRLTLLPRAIHIR